MVPVVRECGRVVRIGARAGEGQQVWPPCEGIALDRAGQRRDSGIVVRLMSTVATFEGVAVVVVHRVGEGVAGRQAGRRHVGHDAGSRDRRR